MLCSFFSIPTTCINAGWTFLTFPSPTVLLRLLMQGPRAAQFSFKYFYLLRFSPAFYLLNDPVLTLYAENYSWCCAVSSQWVIRYLGVRSATMSSSSRAFLAGVILSTSTQAGAIQDFASGSFPAEQSRGT